MALILAEGRLAFVKTDNFEAALKITDSQAADLRRFGMRSFLPATLDVAGQALLGLGQIDEARKRFLEAREVAEALGACSPLWRNLWHLSQIEENQDQAAGLRQEAKDLVNYIAEHAGSSSLRASFLAMPEIRALLEAHGQEGRSMV